MKQVPDTDAKDLFGLKTLHSKMDNGEVRFRLIDRNGLGYVRTIAGQHGSWQNSHFHLSHAETYIVQSGWIAIATLTDEKDLKLLALTEGKIWTSERGLAHNVYMSPSATTHTVKHGVGSENDWHTNGDTELLDRKTKILEPRELENWLFG